MHQSLGEVMGTTIPYVSMTFTLYSAVIVTTIMITEEGRLHFLQHQHRKMQYAAVPWERHQELGKKIPCGKAHNERVPQRESGACCSLMLINKLPDFVQRPRLACIQMTPDSSKRQRGPVHSQYHSTIKCRQDLHTAWKKQSLSTSCLRNQNKRAWTPWAPGASVTGATRLRYYQAKEWSFAFEPASGISQQHFSTNVKCNYESLSKMLVKWLLRTWKPGAHLSTVVFFFFKCWCFHGPHDWNKKRNNSPETHSMKKHLACHRYRLRTK